MTRLMGAGRRARTDALVNGALIALGAAAVLDNVFSHWLLGLHRVVPGSAEAPLQAALGLVMVAIGIARERCARSVVAHPPRHWIDYSSVVASRCWG